MRAEDITLPGAGHAGRLLIRVSGPFRLDYAVWALRRRAHNEVDRFDAGRYRRVLCLARYHVLPGDDVGARNNLRRRFGLAEDAGYDAVASLSRRWQPYAELVYFHLLLDALAARGYLEAAG